VRCFRDMTSPADKYEVIIGLEVHAQLSTQSKMYCGDSAAYGAAPNTQISPLSLGLPGTLPRINKEAIAYAVKLGLATHCRIRLENHFARKNYFYADLPKGYQITQDTTPLCEDGYIDFEVEGSSKRVNIQRIHMEEDAGKSTHDLDPYYSLVDLNRAGVPLVEIVSHPDLRSSEEAYQYLTEVRKLVRYLDICDGNMEEGSLRCDANVSIRLKGDTQYNARVEVKNMNSMRHVKRAIEYEFDRQVELMEKGERLHQETRGFDAVKGITLSQRSKENANDYRYFPEPDLPPVILTESYIDAIRTEMPKLSAELKQIYIGQYGLSEYDARIITDDKDTATYFNALITHTTHYKAAANWILGPIKSYLNDQALDITRFPIGAATMADVIALVEQGKTSFSVASQTIFPELIAHTSETPLAIAERLNVLQSSDEGMIGELVNQVLEQNPDKVAVYKGGKLGLMGFFVGEVIKASKGKADPKLVNKLLSDKLS
jgi:aspartyl-tRNA(Asn)/glutamyl-tRNA(Gln) amidotransferase subunit B